MQVKIILGIIVLLLSVVQLFKVQASEPLELEAAITEALAASPAIAAREARSQAESSMVLSAYWPDNPKLSLMREKGLTRLEQEMGPMQTWAITQEIKFPVKYFLLGRAQKARYEVADLELSQKRLEIRRKVIETYYKLYSAYRVGLLLEAERATLREIARIAESRYGAGLVPQQDEMKAHVEQARIETDIIELKAEVETLEALFGALLARQSLFVLPQTDLKTPELTVPRAEVLKAAVTNSKSLKAGEAMSQEAGTRHLLAKLSYIPDFGLSYKRTFGVTADPNAYAIGIDIGVPLWFFAKQGGEVGQASAQAVEAERNLDQLVLELRSEIMALLSKVEAQARLLKVYETGLIPQATSTLNSSMSAYRAGRIRFMELLDSERSLYGVRIAYYRVLAEYVSAVSELEEKAGRSLSTLPRGEGLL